MDEKMVKIQLIADLAALRAKYTIYSSYADPKGSLKRVINKLEDAITEVETMIAMMELE